MKEEMTLPNSKIDNLKKYDSLMINYSNMVDVMIGNMKVVGLDYNYMNKKVKIITRKFVSSEKKIEFMMNDHMSQHPAQHVYPHNGGNKKSS